MANITFKKLIEQEYAKFRADVKEIFLSLSLRLLEIRIIKMKLFQIMI